MSQIDDLGEAPFEYPFLQGPAPALVVFLCPHSPGKGIKTPWLLRSSIPVLFPFSFSPLPQLGE